MSSNKKINVISILNIVFTILLIIIQSFLVINFINIDFIHFTMLSCFSLCLYIISSCFLIYVISKLDTINLKLLELNQKIKFMQEFQDKAKAFKHDFANIMQGMQGYIENNNMEGLKKYNLQFIDDLNTLNSTCVFTSDMINNPAIYSLISSKYEKATSLGIKFNIEVILNLNILNMKIYEFTRVLGILLDNAIEASKECEEKIINLSISENARNNMQILCIQNTYKETTIDTQKIFEKGFSTKENNSGFGLWEVRQILKKNKNLNLFTTKDNIFFTQQLEMYLK